MQTNFTTVTELPGGGATDEQLSMALTRYTFAANIAQGKDLLEIASGPGIGLGLMAKKAKRVVGGDIDPAQVKMGNNYYKGRFEIVELSAEKLPFADASFDVIIILEAIYYVQHLEGFINEARRVLRPNGQLMITYPNNEWGNFNPSPFTHKYFGIEELHDFLNRYQFSAESHLAFEHRTDTMKAKVIDTIRTVAVKLHLIPKSFAVKDLLKRVFLGKLQPIPNELSETDGQLAPLVAYQNHRHNYSSYRVVYTVATKR